MPLTAKTKYDATVNEHHWIHQTALSTQAFLTPLIRQIIQRCGEEASLSEDSVDSLHPGRPDNQFISAEDKTDTEQKHCSG